MEQSLMPNGEGCIEMLNELTVDMANLNIKAHNLHWNVVGDMFIEAHAQLQEIYEWAQETMDAIAELIRMKGQVPTIDMTNSGIQPAPYQEVGPGECFMLMLGDLSYIREEVQMVYDKATEMADIGSKEVAEDMAEFIDKKVWFLKSILGGM